MEPLRSSPDLVRPWARQLRPELTFPQVSPGMGGHELTRHPERAQVLIRHSKETAAELCGFWNPLAPSQPQPTSTPKFCWGDEVLMCFKADCCFTYSPQWPFFIQGESRGGWDTPQPSSWVMFTVLSTPH